MLGHESKDARYASREREKRAIEPKQLHAEALSDVSGELETISVIVSTRSTQACTGPPSKIALGRT